MVKQDFVSYSLALLLKKAGFNEECREYYNSDKEFGISYTADDFNYLGSTFQGEWFTEAISAPTLAHAQKWLREKKGYIVLCDYLIIPFDKHKPWRFSMSNFFGLCNTPKDHETYPSNEAALASGIEAALKLIQSENATR